MKDIILKWIEYRKLKFERLHCSHEWKLEREIENVDIITSVSDFTYIYFCKKCGEIKKIHSKT